MSADLLLSISAVGFIVALVPAVWEAFNSGKTTITLLSSVPTAILLVNTATALFILDQNWSASLTIGTSIMWAALAAIRYLGD